MLKDKEVPVILLFGQSNMSGMCSYDIFLKRFPNIVNNLQKSYKNIQISFDVDGSTNKNDDVFSDVSFGQGMKSDFFGPEIGIADCLSKKSFKDKVYLIKYSYGGTSLEKSWSSPNMSGDVGPCYKGAIKLCEKSFNSLVERGLRPKIVCICWMQGEEDSVHEDYCQKYFSNSLHFIQDLRVIFKKYSKIDIPFIDCGISSFWERHKEINSSKKSIGSVISNYYFIDSINDLHLEYDKEPTTENADCAHFDSYSEFQLGKAFGDIIVKLLENNGY